MTKDHATPVWENRIVGQAGTSTTIDFTTQSTASGEPSQMRWFTLARGSVESEMAGTEGVFVTGAISILAPNTSFPSSMRARARVSFGRAGFQHQIVFDVGLNTLFSLPGSWCQVEVGIFGIPPLGDQKARIGADLSFGARPGRYALTYSIEYSIDNAAPNPILAGETVTATIPMWAKTVTAYRGDTANEYQITVNGFGTGYSAVCAPGSPFVAMDLTNGARTVQLTNVGPGDDNFVLVFGMQP